MLEYSLNTVGMKWEDKSQINWFFNGDSGSPIQKVLVVKHQLVDLFPLFKLVHYFFFFLLILDSILETLRVKSDCVTLCV